MADGQQLELYMPTNATVYARIQSAGVHSVNLVDGLLEHLEEGALIVDSNLTVLAANAKIGDFLQASPTRLVGASLCDALWCGSPDAVDAIGPCIKNAVIRSQSITLEKVTFQPRDREALPAINLLVSPLANQGPLKTALLKILDVDPERPLAELQRRLNTALSIGHAGIWEWAPASGYYREFGFGQTNLGYEGQDEIADTHALIQRIHPDDRSAFVESLDTLIVGKVSRFENRFRHRHRDGRYLWLLCHGEVLERDHSGVPILVSGYYVDVTELAEISARLKEKEFNLELALESARQGVWDWNIIHDELSGSKSWYELFGYTPETARKIGITEIYHPDDVENTRRRLAATLKGDIDFYESEQRVRRADGEYVNCLIRGCVVARDRDGRALRMVGTHSDISALTEARNALDQRNQQLNLALQNSKQGIWEWDPTTDEFSEFGYLRYEDEAGVDVPIVSGAQLRELTHPDDIDKNNKHLSGYLRGDIPEYSIEHRIRNTDGTYRTMLVRGKVIDRDEHGVVTRVVGTLTDISDIKAQHQRLELALENGGQGMWEWQPIPDIIEFSDSWYALYGYQKNDINNVRDDISKLIHPDDLDRARQSMLDLLKGPDYDYTVEYRFRSKNGQYIWVMERGSVLERDELGRATLVVGTHVDISTQKIAEHEIAESQRFLKLVIDSVPDRVYWKDTRGCYLGVNRQFEIEAGLKDDSEVIGKTDADMPWAEHAQQYQDEDREIIRTGEAQFEIDHGFVDAQGNRHLVETSKIPMLHESGVTIGVLGISAEVTKRRQHEKQMKMLAECITSGSSGRLLDAIARGAVEISGISSALVARLDAVGRIATVVSCYPPNEDINGFAYDVNDTPCANTVSCDVCIYPDNVQSEFPKDRTLVDMGIVSYAGKRLLDIHGNAIGILALLDNKPMKYPDYAMSILDVLSATAASELEREQRENALRDSEKRYRTIYDNVPAIICTVDDQHEIIDVNNAWIAATGYTFEQTVGSHLSDYFTDESRALYLALPSNNTQTQRVADIKLDFRCKDQRIIKLSFNATRTISAKGTPVTVTVLEDVTAKISYEQELRLAATAFETHEALVIRDAEKHILRVNNAFKNITGYCDADVVGRISVDSDNTESSDDDQAQIWQSVDLCGMWEGERVNHRTDGTKYATWRTITAVQDDAGEISHYVENFSDITELKLALAEAEKLAYYDPLTDLPNRRFLVEKLEANIKSLKQSNTTGALLFVDLDQFKTINDSLGHAVGDALLIQVAKRLRNLMRQEDTIGRLGGDEFVIVLFELARDRDKAREQAGLVAKKIHAELGKTYELDNHAFKVTPTIGVTLFPEDGKT
ncbi:MAG: PAS domain S-box protein, partial [Pseudomonadota bacterium]